VKGVGDKEILEMYLNSASKNTSETGSFPHGTKPLLTSVIIMCVLVARHKLASSDLYSTMVRYSTE